ncbi:MAG: cyclic nucleotide-binding domain-containing protein [Chloroflexi bacterium]|nr:cyclic nucleotide-binding domain-containing protein [Chloroflexota bacterium]
MRGKVEVTIAGRLIRTQGPGEGFGEIALLRDVPRTATVRALTEVQFLSLNRDSFLLALTGHRDSRRAAERAVDARLRGDTPTG